VSQWIPGLQAAKTAAAARKEAAFNAMYQDVLDGLPHNNGITGERAWLLMLPPPAQPTATCRRSCNILLQPSSGPQYAWLSVQLVVVVVVCVLPNHAQQMS
jgi:hypothetical protein